MAVTLILVLISLSDVSAQMPIKMNVSERVLPDTTDLEYYGRKHFWRAGAEVVGFNMGLWAYDRYVQHGDFAYISLHSIRENFRRGFIWDNDRLGTNMFLHPYNGNLYYNAARSNGFNYWQSGLFAIGGSAMWELFMECEYPSTNDIIATPIGGMAIGEVCYRASDLILDDRSTGWTRFGREAGAFVVSPLRGVTRILNGDAWRHRATSGRQFGIPNIGVEFSLGSRTLEFRHDNVDDVKTGFTLGVNMEYGDRFEVRSTSPYDYFTLRANLNFITSQPVLSRLNIKGRLLARELFDHRREDLSIGLYQHFDFYDSDTISKVHKKCPYKLGVPACVGAGVMFRDPFSKNFIFDAFAHANVVLLGGVLSDYYQLDERNYNLASGFSVKGGLHCVWDKEKFSFTASHAFYRLYTWKGYAAGTDLTQVNPKTLNAQGDKSSASFGITEISAQMQLSKKLYLGVELQHFFRSTAYRDYPDVHSSAFSESLQLIYKL